MPKRFCDRELKIKETPVYCELEPGHDYSHTYRDMDGETEYFVIWNEEGNMIQ